MASGSPSEFDSPGNAIGVELTFQHMERQDGTPRANVVLGESIAPSPLVFRRVWQECAGIVKTRFGLLKAAAHFY